MANITYDDMVFGDDTKSGPLLVPWEDSIKDFCYKDPTSVSGCATFLASYALVLGCCLTTVALIFGIILVQDKSRTKSKRKFLLHYEKLLFWNKFLGLLGFYFIFLFVIDIIGFFDTYNEDVDINALTYQIMYLIVGSAFFISSLIIFVSIWQRQRNPKHGVNGKCPANIISVEAIVVFQDFTYLYPKAMAIAMTQILLLLIYTYAVMQNIIENLRTMNETLKFLVLGSYTLAALMQASYVVGTLLKK